ncbi:TetR/AcrR family transcriptional regulator [Streptomyces avicenniae]|uniref:TetR/AcrR family transcriptional regulator n=1 Tax=Streptomyces avicenniae TaxID=500153 RepID=UPI00069ADAE9|nr:TetR/AcrR family transcriptional regulator [Streptomyces avicenniae]
MPRPRSLTPAQLADAALAVLDQDGPAGLTMRAVADRLGMSTMALYRYVAGRAELERLVVDRVLRDIDVTPPPAPWDRQVAALMERARAAVAEHPATVPLLVAHRHGAAGVWRWSEAVLTALTAAGLDGTRRVVALRALTAYLIGALQNNRLGPLAGPGTEALAALPPDDHPLLAATAADAGGLAADDEFRGGLDLLLGGLRAEADGAPG